MGPFGLQELLIIFAIFFLIFGIKRLPGLGRGLGEAITNFRDALTSQSREKKRTEEL